MMQKLRNFYFAVFERDKVNKRCAASILIESSDEASESRLYSFLDTLSTDMDPSHFVQTLGFPVEFLQSLLDWLRTHEIDSQDAVPVSFLEITFGVLKISPVQFPFPNLTTGNWTLMDRRSLFERPTLTNFYGIIQKYSQGVSASLPILV